MMFLLIASVGPSSNLKGHTALLLTVGPLGGIRQRCVLPGRLLGHSYRPGSSVAYERAIALGKAVSLIKMDCVENDSLLLGFTTARDKVPTSSWPSRLRLGGLYEPITFNAFN